MDQNNALLIVTLILKLIGAPIWKQIKRLPYFHRGDCQLLKVDLYCKLQQQQQQQHFISPPPPPFFFYKQKRLRKKVKGTGFISTNFDLKKQMLLVLLTEILSFSNKKMPVVQNLMFNKDILRCNTLG